MHATAKRPPQHPQPIVYDLDEAAALLRVGRSTLYELIARGELASIKIGRRRLITHEAALAFLASKATPSS